MADKPGRPATGQPKKRRRKRLLPVTGFVVVAIGLAWFFELQATTTVLLVRHADTDAAMMAADDPPLNERGRERAEILADVLEYIDVVDGVDAIYVSEFRRTQQTAEPLAKRLGIEMTVADPYDVEPFMAQLLRDHKGEIVLIVTHSDAISPLVVELHGSKHLPVIAPDEHDQLYVVTIPWFGKVKTLRLRYGVPWQEDLPLKLSDRAE
jgi:broad specificity phosphatase PhoE